VFWGRGVDVARRARLAGEQAQWRVLVRCTLHTDEVEVADMAEMEMDAVLAVVAVVLSTLVVPAGE
jgi:hypothetical protein